VVGVVPRADRRERAPGQASDYESPARHSRAAQSRQLPG
jgi:hypothetical protein